MSKTVIFVVASANIDFKEKANYENSLQTRKFILRICTVFINLDLY